MTNEELKPCPFCGGEAKRIDVCGMDFHNANAGGSYIICTRCLSSSMVMFGEKVDLEELWNTRSDDVRLKAYNKGYRDCRMAIDMGAEDYQAETSWMIEATKEQQETFGLNGPAWWTGDDPNINEFFSTDPNEGIRFSRKQDAENVIKGWGYSLENKWVFATEHRWG